MIVIIPARSGSKGVPDKNIRLLNGHPLFAYSIVTAKMIPGIDRVIVSTDSEVYANLANKYGAETPFLRPAGISGDKSSDLEVFTHALQWLKEKGEEIPEYMLHLRPTTPLRDPVIIKQAIDHFLANGKEASSLRSGHPAPESPFKWFLKDESGYFKGLRDDLTPEKINLPRQSFPDVYIPDGYIDIIKSSCVLETNTLHGNRMMVFESPHCHEVDVLEDFNYLEFQLKREGSVVLDCLNKYNASKK
jgi:CMP-N,N'-diacetyllegionaminic acid synthase